MYTSQGYMTQDDYNDYLKSTDQGVTTYIPYDNPPSWMRIADNCPVCSEQIIKHESVTVQDASGEIYACIDSAGVSHHEDSPNEYLFF